MIVIELPAIRMPFEPLHILFNARRDDATAFTWATAQAETTLDEVKASPEYFERLAAVLSDCSSASEGGRLGQVARGETTPEFEAALVSLEAGQVYPEPVQTRYGVYVIKLERKVAGETLAFEQCMTDLLPISRKAPGAERSHNT